MKELCSVADPVLLSILRFRLDEEGLDFDVFDSHVSSLFPGDIYFANTRVMVSDEHFDRSKKVLEEILEET